MGVCSIGTTFGNFSCGISVVFNLNCGMLGFSRPIRCIFAAFSSIIVSFFLIVFKISYIVVKYVTIIP